MSTTVRPFRRILVAALAALCGLAAAGSASAGSASATMGVSVTVQPACTVQASTAGAPESGTVSVACSSAAAQTIQVGLSGASVAVRTDRSPGRATLVRFPLSARPPSPGAVSINEAPPATAGGVILVSVNF